VIIHADAVLRRVESGVFASWETWRMAIPRTLSRMLGKRVSLAAAGCAFYGTLALFPAISMLISIYGLVFDRHAVLPQLAVLQDLLPPDAFRVIAERVTELVRQRPGILGWHLVASTAFTFWSAANGTKSVITALNLAYEEPERRGFLRYQLTALGMTLGVIFATAIGLALLVALPAALHLLGFAGHTRAFIRGISFALLVVSVTAALSLLYRYAPSRRIDGLGWITPGSCVATAIWVAASALFSWFVGRFATYDAMYGPLGTVIAIMMWFYVTAYAVLLGAELNAALESQRAHVPERAQRSGPAPHDGSATDRGGAARRP
jgi:membrane protein